MTAITDFFKTIGAWLVVGALAVAGLFAALWRRARRREVAADARADAAEQDAAAAHRSAERTSRVEAEHREVQAEAQTQKEIAAEKLARELKAIDAIGEAAINNPSDLDLVLEEANRRLAERKAKGGK